MPTVSFFSRASTICEYSVYIHKKSNHPPSFLKNTPESIKKRLSEISSDKEFFDNTKSVYQEALTESGYNYNLSYKETHNEMP